MMTMEEILALTTTMNKKSRWNNNISKVYHLDQS
jgi:hypothetical protein